MVAAQGYARILRIEIGNSYQRWLQRLHCAVVGRFAERLRSLEPRGPSAGARWGQRNTQEDCWQPQAPSLTKRMRRRPQKLTPRRRLLIEQAMRHPHGASCPSRPGERLAINAVGRMLTTRASCRAGRAARENLKLSRLSRSAHKRANSEQGDSSKPQGVRPNQLCVRKEVIEKIGQIDSPQKLSGKRRILEIYWWRRVSKTFIRSQVHQPHQHWCACWLLSLQRAYSDTTAGVLSGC